MAGINLLDQLKNKKSGAGLSAPSSSPLKFSFGGGGGGASGDSMSLVLRLLSLGIALYVGYFVLEKLHGDETSKLQTELTQLEKSLAEENIKKL